MTESEWLACNRADTMLLFVTGPASTARPVMVGERKLRLLGCAFARTRVGLTSYALCEIERAERIADGFDRSFSSRADYAEPIGLLHPSAERAAWAGLRSVQSRQGDRSGSLAALMREVLGNPFRPWCREGDGLSAPWTTPRVTHPADVMLLRRAWLTPDVVRTARGIYGDRDFAALPVLADALMEAGCDNLDLLAHLDARERPCPSCLAILNPTSGGLWPCLDCGATDWDHHGWVPVTHALGCWALDLILGKE